MAGLGSAGLGEGSALGSGHVVTLDALEKLFAPKSDLTDSVKSHDMPLPRFRIKCHLSRRFIPPARCRRPRSRLGDRERRGMTW